MKIHTIPANAVRVDRASSITGIQLTIDARAVKIDAVNTLPDLVVWPGPSVPELRAHASDVTQLVFSNDDPRIGGSLTFAPESTQVEAAADVLLERFRGTGIQLANPTATFGRMTLPDGMTLVTVEDAWRDNQRNISCIPVGVYQCKPRRFNRGGYDAIEVTNVPGRSHILIHKGNTADDLNGCIAPGMVFAWIQNQLAVGRSGEAFQHVMEQLGGKDFTLKIVDIT